MMKNAINRTGSATTGNWAAGIGFPIKTIKPSAKKKTKGTKKRMGAYHIFLTILLRSKALPNNLFAPSQPFSLKLRIKAAAIGAGVTRGIKANAISGVKTILFEAKATSIYAGIAKRKVNTKKAKGNLFFIVLALII
ncbi:hypothetical protein ACFLVG_00505 [Chloroflexota bacterium]